MIVDLFSGCGGFALGAELAGFHCEVAVDIDSTLQSSYKLNFPEAHPILADIGLLEKSAWRFLLKDRRPDGLIGGPPCQGFSWIGKRAVDDPRNTLIWHFFRQVALLDPKFFIMENVQGLLDEGNVDLLMTACQQVAPRFTVLDPMIVTASDFGAPTCRTRVIVIGYNPNEIGPLSLKDFEPPTTIPQVTVRDAISDLPCPIMSSRGKDDYAWSKYPPLDGELSDYATWARRLPRPGLGWERSITRLRDRQSSGHEATIHSESVAARYGALAVGEICKVSKAKRLDWNGVCPTLRAGTGREKGAHQAVRPIHPTEARVITVREAARMQGFPDWFVFHPTKWSSFRMIGNSVSPKVSEFLLGRMMHHLRLQEAA